MPPIFNNDRLRDIVERRQASPQSRVPLEQGWQRTNWRWIFSRHNGDLAVVAALYLSVLTAAIVGLFASGIAKCPAGLLGAVQILFGTAIFGTFMELIRRVFDTALKRLATIDIFTSEMLSIMRVFVAGNIVGEFVRLYDQLLARSPADTAVSTPSGFADAARKENYFSIFEKNAADLASLNPAAVNDITAFYTFLKGARDATGAMQLWQNPTYPPASKREDIVAILYLCFLMSVHGRLALQQLVSSRENMAVIEDIFAGVQLQCFAFLDIALPGEDYRRGQLDKRRDSIDRLRREFGYGF